MNKFSMILFILWMVLAVASFVCNFFIPVTFIKVLGFVFGGFNLLIINSWVITYFQGLKAARELKKMEGKEDGVQL